MKLTDEYEMSGWALNQCRNGNDTPEMRGLINNVYHSYLYCRDVNDRKKIWSKITDSCVAYWYCKNVKDRPEVRRYIKNEINKRI